MFQTLDQILSHIKDYQVEMVDLKFCDLWGRWHHLTIPARLFNQGLMEKGIGFDCSFDRGPTLGGEDRRFSTQHADECFHQVKSPEEDGQH